MPFIIPNADDTGDTNPYLNINQAEPDALDVEALGLRDNWIRSGGAVTVSGGLVSVASGVAVIGGKPYSFAASSSVAIANTDSATEYRFDAVIVRVTSGTATAQIVQGAASTTNPMLPRSKSLVTEGDIDPDTDVLLATVLKYGSNAITSRNVVDKRIVSHAAVTWTTAASVAPSDSTVSSLGDTVISESTGSVYMKVKTTGTGRWKEIAKSDNVADFVLPIGAIFAWSAPGTDPPNDSISGEARYRPCNGAELSIAEYGDLHSVIGNTYGGTYTHFNLPNITGSTVIAGVSRNYADYGEVEGSNSVTLVEDNIPRHAHGSSHQHRVRLQNNSTAGSSNRAMAANTSVGTENTTAYTLNEQLEGFGKGTPDAIDVRGKRIYLSYYIRVK